MQLAGVEGGCTTFSQVLGYGSAAALRPSCSVNTTALDVIENLAEHFFLFLLGALKFSISQGFNNTSGDTSGASDFASRH